jgi:hypothetical protein
MTPRSLIATTQDGAYRKDTYVPHKRIYGQQSKAPPSRWSLGS